MAAPNGANYELSHPAARADSAGHPTKGGGGKTQYCRDTLVTAMGAANIIQSRNPNSHVAVRDLQTGQLTVLPKPATQTQ